MMTNAKESCEAKILEKIIENSAKLAVNGSELSQVKVEIKNLSNEVKAIDTRLTKVEEKIDGVEETIKQINSKQNWFFTILAGIGTGILATLYSQPILNGLSHLRYFCIIYSKEAKPSYLSYKKNLV